MKKLYLALALTACGSGDGDDAAPQTPTAGPVASTQANPAPAPVAAAETAADVPNTSGVGNPNDPTPGSSGVFYDRASGRWYSQCSSTATTSQRQSLEMGAAGWVGSTVTYGTKDCIGAPTTVKDTTETYRTLATDSFSGWFRLVSICVDKCQQQTMINYFQVIGGTLFRMDQLGGPKAEYKAK